MRRQAGGHSIDPETGMKVTGVLRRIAKSLPGQRRSEGWRYGKGNSHHLPPGWRFTDPQVEKIMHELFKRSKYSY